MKFSTILMVSAIVAATHAQYDESESSFESWRAKFEVIYETQDEATTRFGVWKDNLHRVASHNAREEAGLETYRMGMNIHADLTNAEYRAFRLRPRENVERPWGQVMPQPFEAANNGTPTSIDWVKQGVVTPIKDQGQCGSCWAFSAVAAMEGAYNLAHPNGSVDSSCTTKCGPNNVTCCSFSEQEVADCTLDGKDKCNIGGEPHDGILEVVGRKGEIATDAEYPYVSGKTQKLTRCERRSKTVTTGITGYVNITSGDEAAMATALQTRPVLSIGIDASSFGFQLYDSGVYTDDSCGNTPKKLDHGVAVVGFGFGVPKPPGPLPPPPGPEACNKGLNKYVCTHTKGCHWCVDKSGFGFCFNQKCGLSAKPPTPPKPQAYWLVRNSWGDSWGMGGYIAMAKDRKNMCGVATDAVYAVVGKEGSRDRYATAETTHPQCCFCDNGGEGSGACLSTSDCAAHGGGYKCKQTPGGCTWTKPTPLMPKGGCV